MHIKNHFKSEILSIVICFVAALLLIQLHTGCGGNDGSTDEDISQESRGIDNSPAAAAQPAANTQDIIEGKVVETMNAGRYTYILVQTSNEKIWVAGPLTDIEIDDRVVLPMGMFMKDFKSETLDRTFEKIYFVPSLVGQSAGGMDADELMLRAHGGRDVMSDQKNAGDDGGGSPAGRGTTVVPREDVGDFVKAPGGLTVAEIYSRKSELAGQKVKVRGAVVKFTPGIMNTNWLHLQDGTGLDGFHDLTVTTNATVKVGDLITVQGVLSVDKDFGAGYRYDVIVERAELIAE